MAISSTVRGLTRETEVTTYLNQAIPREDGSYRTIA